jgi:hypothetical protein
MDINDVFSSVDQAIYIKNQEGFSDYYAGFGWFGAISDINAENMYKLNLGTNNPDTLYYSGAPVDPSSRPMDLSSGWNWIGYLPQVSMPINDALATIDGSGIYIKSQDGFSDYYAGFGWFGAVENMDPLDGYQLNMSNSDVLIYPSEGSFSRVDSYDSFEHQSLNDFNFRDYEFNGSITAEVNVNELSAFSINDMLIASVDGEYRGYAKPVYFPLTENYIFQMMIYSSISDGEKVSFQYYSALSNEYYNISETIEFSEDMIIGNGLNPYPLHSTMNELTEELSVGSAYPNPFNPVTNIEYSIKEAGNIAIEIFDVMGRHVETLHNGYQSLGTHSVTWDASNKSSGIYYIQVVSNQNIKTQKVVLLK